MDVKQLALVTVVLAVSSMTLAQARSRLTLDMQAHSRDGEVVVDVLVKNRSAHTHYVPRVMLESKAPFGKFFDVTAEQGAAVDYKGPMVKRRPYGPDDYRAVAPGQSVRGRFDLSQAYGFLPGTHHYLLQYTGPLPVAHLRDIGRSGRAPAPLRLMHTAH